jgi:hypothetical protein
MDINWAVASTAPNEFAATLWRDILIDAGIQAFIKSTEAATFLVASAILPVQVMVPRERLAEARSLLADVEILDPPGELTDE